MSYSQVKNNDPEHWGTMASRAAAIAAEAESVGYDLENKHLDKSVRGEVGRLAFTDLSRISSEWQILAIAMRSVADVFSSLETGLVSAKQELQGIVDQAISAGFDVDASGQVTEGVTDDPNTAASYTAQIAAIVDRARGVDELGAQIVESNPQASAATDVSSVHGSKNPDALAVRSSRTSREMVVKSMPVGQSAGVQAQWWNSLSEEQRATFRRAAPLQLYDMAGVPADEKQSLAGPGPYNRIEALRYAETHAVGSHDPRATNDCTNFASRALRAGGQKENDDWYADGGWIIGSSPGQTNWVNTADNLAYLKASHRAAPVTLDQAQPGDLVYFKDGDTGKAHHMAMVTSVLPNGDVLYTQHQWDASQLSLNARQPVNNTGGPRDANIEVLRPQ